MEIVNGTSIDCFNSVGTPTIISNAENLAIVNCISFTPSPLIQESVGDSSFFLLPGCSSKELIPHCPIEDKPVKGMTFKTLSAAVRFYHDYAFSCGFKARFYSQRKVGSIVVSKRMVCSKEGFRESSKQEIDGVGASDKKKRNRAVTRVGCKAFIYFVLDRNGHYSVMSFHEGHNHPMLTPTTKHHLKRKLNVGLQHVIASNQKINKGPNISFRATKEILGGYDKVGASLVDFKNFARDLKVFVGDNDGQMFIDILNKRKEVCPCFFFEYDLDDEGCLIRAFWCDPIGQRNYILFGDAVSFDTTFRTNKYSMVFCPFTGIDHHNKCITFAAGLIWKEDIESFTWLFQAFVRCMGGRQPITIITDQDAAMKIAIDVVFTNCTHKCCMWHIMKKFKDKIPPDIFHNTDFMKKICSVVWNHEIDPEEFEKNWDSVMDEFGLTSYDPMTKLFDIRQMWIPAYFRDLFLGGLIRTTSRSESENNFFNTFTNRFLSLVELWARFESAMDAQRHAQSVLSKDSNTSSPILKTPLGIEKHAADVFTHTVFYEFQEEIWHSLFSCNVKEFTSVGDVDKIVLHDNTKNKVYHLSFHQNTEECNCSCKMFERKGLPCKHLVWLFKEKGYDQLPSRFVLDRWTKEGPKKPVFDMAGNLLKDVRSVDETKRLIGDQWAEFMSCVDIAFGNKAHMEDLVACLKEFKEKISSNPAHFDKLQKKSVLEVFVGTSIPEEVIVKNPKQSKNKGSGKRLRSAKEIAVEKNNKPKRLCNLCGEYGYHDSRNCLTTRPCK